MIQRLFQGKDMPMLSVGCMRLPVVNGDDSVIDEEAAAEMLDYAITRGANYFDVAWGYHGGNAEPVVGKLLAKYPREDFYLATKFPGYDSSRWGKVQETFEAQLERCGVDYFDFYLFHNLCEMNIDAYLDPKYGIFDYLMAQKEAGRIRHLGFSAHASLETMERFLEAYGEHMEFCQLQVNWLDWEFQNSKAKVKLCAEYGIPVWVMEPVRGGKLANLASQHEATLKELRPEESVAAWSLRFLQGIPQVTTILCGASTLAQMKDNVRTLSEYAPLNAEEQKALDAIAKEMMDGSLPCTSCRYCMQYCPMQLDIPYLISLYNERKYTGEGDFIAPMGLESLSEDKLPSMCIGCKACEQVCPQNLEIAAAMTDFAALSECR